MKKFIYLLTTLTAFFLLTACATQSPVAPSQSTAEVTLIPYATTTSTPSITPTPLDQPTQTPRPTITPTPRIYEIRAEDTLLSIAYYYGVTLEELQAANPDVNPSLMKIGATLVIPPAREATGTVAAPTPTPFPATRGEINCLPSATNGLHCFFLVANNLKNSAANLTGEFRILDVNGEVVTSHLVALPLKLLAPGARIPFYTYFTSTPAEGQTILFNLLTATKAQETDTGVFPLKVLLGESTIAGDGSSANISGTIELENDEVEFNRITIVAVAYDSMDNVVGLRRIEEDVAVTAGSTRPFTIAVFSSGGEIVTVEVYTEAENN